MPLLPSSGGSARKQARLELGATNGSAKKQPRVRYTIRHLAPAALEQLITVDKEVFPESFQMHPAELYYYLTSSEIKGNNYSLGVFDGTRLLGYMLMIRIPSEFQKDQEILLLMRMGIYREHRKATSTHLMVRALIEAMLSGLFMEGKFREITAFRSIQRISETIHRYGFRITSMIETDRIGNDRMIHIRAENLILHYALIYHIWRTLVVVDHTRRVLLNLPRRILRRVCLRFPQVPFPMVVRQFAYLTPPPIPPTPETAPSPLAERHV